MKAALADKLNEIPQLRCTQLQKALSNLHASRLDNARQILKMEQAKKDNKPPAGWKMQTLHMPAGSDTHKQAAELKMLKAYCECYDDMIASRQDATSQATAEMQELVDNASTAQLHISQHVMLNNPDRYAGITEQHNHTAKALQTNTSNTRASRGRRRSQGCQSKQHTSSKESEAADCQSRQD